MIARLNSEAHTLENAVQKLFAQQVNIIRLQAKNRLLVLSCEEVLKCIPSGNKAYEMLDSLIMKNR